MRKNYWKECCLLLLGSLIGCVYQKHIDPLLIPKTDMVDSNIDTIVIRDTITKIVKAKVPTRERVERELIVQNVPHHEIVLKQAIHETGNFKSKLTKTHNNIFGLRKGNSYRKYPNYQACIADYKRLISKRYKGGDYYKFLLDLGYATDPEYINKLKKIV